jgi:hypothetical protein
MQQIWGHFDSLGPHEMFGAYSEAVNEYQQTESKTPDAAGMQEVDGFAGRRPLYAYQLSRAWELALHCWDVYVARNKNARLDPDAVALLAEGLQFMNLPLDKERASALSALGPVVLHLRDSGRTYTLDPTAERPRVQIADAGASGGLELEGPDEEIIRFVAGRHFVPGAHNALKVTKGSTEDLASFRRAFR